MHITAPIARMSYAEYLVAEEAAEIRHEYVRGAVYAMAGGTIEHGGLAANALMLLGLALRGRRCRVFGSDVRVRIPAVDVATYPDVSVVCGAVARADDDRNAITNPVLLVEVLSASTEAYDRGEKAEFYRAIPSLREYLLISQRTQELELFRRVATGRWERKEAGPRSMLRLTSIGVTLATDDVYRDPLQEA